ncbi:MAG: packaged DNA stabilization protein, partial [bacterium]
MPVIELTVGHEGRPRVGLPTKQLVNAYAEATKEGPTGAARLPRPGLTDWGTAGDGPILRQFQSPGLFNGALFSVSGGTLYRDTTSLGAVPYSLQPRMAANLTQLAIVSGGALFVYDGAALTLVPYFDDGVSRLPPFSSVTVLFNIFVYTVAGSNQFYFSNTGDATLINAANFANAETMPDPILEVATLADELYFFGSRTIEPWSFTGSLTLPFQLAQGRTYNRGTAAQGSVVKLDNSLFWVGDDLSVYRASAVPEKISTPYIDDTLRQARDGI